MSVYLCTCACVRGGILKELRIFSSWFLIVNTWNLLQKWLSVQNVNCFQKKEWVLLKETSWILLCQAAPPLTTADRYTSPSWLLSSMHPIPVTHGRVSIHPRTPVHVLHTSNQNIHSLGVLQREYVLNTYKRTHDHVRVCHACGKNLWVRLYTPVRALSEQHARAVWVCVFAVVLTITQRVWCASACVCMCVHVCACVCVCMCLHTLCTCSVVLDFI